MNLPLPLWDAARFGLAEEISSLAGVLDFTKHPQLAAFALAPAAYRGHVTCVRALLKYIKKSMPGTGSALNAATRCGHCRCVWELIPFCSLPALRAAIRVGESELDPRSPYGQLALRLLRAAVTAEAIAAQHPNVGASLASQA